MCIIFINILSTVSLDIFVGTVKQTVKFIFYFTLPIPLLCQSMCHLLVCFVNHCHCSVNHNVTQYLYSINHCVTYWCVLSTTVCVLATTVSPNTSTPSVTVSLTGVFCQPLSVSCQPVSVFCQPLSVFCQPVSVFCEPLSVFCQPLPVFCQPLSVFCQPLSVFCQPLSLISVFSYNTITSSAPSYLSELLYLYRPSRPVRSSSDTRLLKLHRVNRKTHGFRSFSHFGPPPLEQSPPRHQALCYSLFLQKPTQDISLLRIFQISNLVHYQSV